MKFLKFERKVENIDNSSNKLYKIVKRAVKEALRESEQDQVQQCLKEKKEIAKKLLETEQELESQQKYLKKLKEELLLSDQNDWEQAVCPFMKIEKLARCCPSMNYLLREEIKLSNLDQMNKQDKITFVNRFAWEFSFARMVYESMKKYKEKNPEPITKEELELVYAINAYYKERYGEPYTDFDALDCLLLTEGKVAFNRKKMMVLNDYKNVNLVDATVLYVPALRMQNGKDIEKKAIIGGR